MEDMRWQKKCPMCGGRMDYHIRETKWMCYSCGFETGGDAPERSETKSEPATAFDRGPAWNSMFEPSAPPSGSTTVWPSDDEPIKGSLKGSSSSKSQQSMKKKTCPSCRKKMNFYEEEKLWRCPYCEYERRI